MQRLALRCALALSLGLTAVGTLGAPSASAATATITALRGNCLDVAGDTSANGPRAEIWTCGGAANPKWPPPAAGGTPPPATAPMAVAPYLYNGWGNPPSPTTVMNATGVKWFTLAFVLSNGYCNPQWDGG